MALIQRFLFTISSKGFTIITPDKQDRDTCTFRVFKESIDQP